MDILDRSWVEFPGVPDRLARLDYRSAVDGVRDWALCCPPSRGETWVVKVHGHGSQGDQLYTRPDIKAMWLPLIRQYGLGILTPNLRDNAWMSPAAADDLHALLDLVRREYGARRFILASGSMGGTSNVIYGVLHPEEVDGLVALCPATDLAVYHRWCRERNEGVIREIADAIESAYGGAPEQQPDRYQRHSALRHAERLTMPLFMAHGDADALIPVSEARALAEALGAARHSRYVEMPGGHHDSPLALMPEAMDWVMKRMKGE